MTRVNPDLKSITKRNGQHETCVCTANENFVYCLLSKRLRCVQFAKQSCVFSAEILNRVVHANYYEEHA